MTGCYLVFKTSIRLNKLSLLCLAFSIFGSFECKSQIQTPDYKNGIIIIEKLLYSEALEREAANIKEAQINNKISSSWKVSGSSIDEKRLNKDYEKIIAGLKKIGVKYKIVNTNEFKNAINVQAQNTYCLIRDFVVRQDGNYLVIDQSFKLLNSKNEILMDEPPSGIIKLIEKNYNENLH